MSIPVPVTDLWGKLAERGARAYLLTVGEEARPHAVHVATIRDGEALVIEVGKRTAANASARPLVSLVYPVRTDGDYSLIVDGTAVVEGSRVRITPVKAVLHRSAKTPDPLSPCGSDCVPLGIRSPR